MIDEIAEIPERAAQFLSSSGDYTLPVHVPYLGMGSSYFSALAFKYMGIGLLPEMASEYVNYLSHRNKQKEAVLISQSGKSTETVWCTSLFEQFTVITNDTASTIALHPSAKRVIGLRAGEEKYSSSKTYINTLLALFKGFGFDCNASLQLLQKNMASYEQKGKELATSVLSLLREKPDRALYITGNGPNIATALEAALILSESTKLNFNGLPMAQYDHGPKETAKDSILIMISAKGNTYERNIQLSKSVSKAGATVLTVEEPEAVEHFSVLHNIVPFNFLAYYLAEHLGVKEIFAVGNKVTEVK